MPAASSSAGSDAGEPLGVISGGGALPRLVAEAQKRDGGAAFVVALRGFAEPWVREWPHAVCGVGQAGKIFSALRAAGCRRVCIAGGLSRPSMGELVRSFRLDLTGVKVALRVARLLRMGDDGLLRGVAALFEERGFELVAAQSLLGELMAPEGALGRVTPTPRDLEDIDRAARIVEALGPVDVGQGAIVAQGRCLAVETVFGTDAMLSMLAGRTDRHGASIPSGALYKAPKPGQDERLDVPTIGPRTVDAVRAAGLNGVAVEAGAVFVIDAEATARAADKAGVFVYGRPAAARPGKSA